MLAALSLSLLYFLFALSGVLAISSSGFYQATAIQTAFFGVRSHFVGGNADYAVQEFSDGILLNIDSDEEKSNPSSSTLRFETEENPVGGHLAVIRLSGSETEFVPIQYVQASMPLLKAENR